jgi:lipoprotein NlpI/transglutaminase-like putative cysteine protease
MALCASVALLGNHAAAQSVDEAGGNQPALREVQVAATQFQRAAPLPPWVEPYSGVPATGETAPAVTLLADSQFSVAHQAYYVHRIWQLNASSAMNDLGQQTIDFNPAYQRVKLHALRLHRAGQVVDKLPAVRLNFLQRETGLEQGVYSGAVVAVMLLDDLRLGDQVEIAYTVEGANPVLGGRFAEAAAWDQGVPTEVRRITVKHPPERAIAWKFVTDDGRPAPAPEDSVQAGVRRLRWEAKRLPRIEAEPRVPPDHVQYAMLQFSEFRSWGEVADWADQLFQVATPGAPALAALVAEFQRQPTPDARAAAALRWVQEHIRYVSLSFGESSHRPAQPLVTLERRYGDCKDKSLLLVHLLRAMGLRAQPVLVAGASRRGAEKLLPSPYAFDHAIVRVEMDGKPYFLDPTRQPQPSRLAAMGQLWEDARVLVVDRGDGRFVTIASSDPIALERDELAEKMSIPRLGGPGKLSSIHVWSGLNAEYRRTWFAQTPPEEMSKQLLEGYEERYPGAKHASAPRVVDDAENNVLTLHQELELPTPAVKLNSDAGWVVRYRPANLLGLVRMPPSATRRQPYWLGLPQRSSYAMEVEFPPEVSKVNDPAQRSVRDPAFELKSSTAFRGNRASVQLEHATLRDRVEPRRVESFMAALRRTGELPLGFVVEKGDIKSTSFLQPSAPTLAKSIERRLSERLGKFTKSIESGRLAGEDLAEAHCQRAETLIDLDRPGEAMKDAQQAVKLAPDAMRPYTCRGSAYFSLADFARSVADYSKAITLDPTEPRIYYSRGRSRYYAGQLAAAAEDFAKSGLEGKHDDNESVLYPELWRVWTQKRLGATPTPAQVKLAADDPRGEWPRPALALFHGLLSVDEMFTQVERKRGDDKELALVEAYFYAGKWHQLQGDDVRARELFAKAREKGITMYVEHISAGIELGLTKKSPAN